jgi:hypothetical protein
VILLGLEYLDFVAASNSINISDQVKKVKKKKKKRKRKKGPGEATRKYCKTILRSWG